VNAGAGNGDGGGLLGDFRLIEFFGHKVLHSRNFGGNLNEKLYVAGAGAANGSAEVLTHEKQIPRPPQADSEGQLFGGVHADRRDGADVHLQKYSVILAG
jgi:hypothetical protein